MRSESIAFIVYAILLLNSSKKVLAASPHKAIAQTSVSNCSDPESGYSSSDDDSNGRTANLFSFRSIINYFRGESMEDEYNYDVSEDGANDHNLDDDSGSESDNDLQKETIADNESSDDEDIDGYRTDANGDYDHDDEDDDDDDDYDDDKRNEKIEAEHDNEDDDDDDDDYQGFYDDFDYQFYSLHGMTNALPTNRTRKVRPNRSLHPVLILNNTSKANSTLEIKIRKPDEQTILKAFRNATDTVLNSKGFTKVVSEVNDIIYKGLTKASNNANMTEMSKWYTLYNIILDSGPKNFVKTLTTDPQAKQIVKGKLKNGADYAQNKINAVDNFRKNVKKLISTDQLVTNFNVSSRRLEDAGRAFSFSKVLSFFSPPALHDEVGEEIGIELETKPSGFIYYNCSHNSSSNSSNIDDDSDDDNDGSNHTRNQSESSVIDGAVGYTTMNALLGIILATIVTLII